MEGALAMLLGKADELAPTITAAAFAFLCFHVIVSNADKIPRRRSRMERDLHDIKLLEKSNPSETGQRLLDEMKLHLIRRKYADMLCRGNLAANVCAEVLRRNTCLLLALLANAARLAQSLTIGPRLSIVGALAFISLYPLALGLDAIRARSAERKRPGTEQDEHDERADEVERRE